MKKHIFSLLIGICIGIQLFAQENKPTTPNPREDGAYLYVDKMPEFPGGMNAMMQYLNSNIKYPAQAKQENISGRVLVQFVVEPDGKLDKIKIMKSIHPLLDDEAIRVIKSMPLWTPGKHKGQVVPVVFNIPILFNNAASSHQANMPKKIIITGDSKIENPEIAGLWQMFFQVTPGEKEGSYEGIAIPFMKTLLPDGSFYNLILDMKIGKFIATAQGKFEKTSNNTYVEKIASSLTAPFLNDKEVEINFEFLNSNLIKLTFSMPGNPQILTEYWGRITMPESSLFAN